MPQLVARESGTLIQRLAEVTNTRHAKFGKTIFHLEPNLKGWTRRTAGFSRHALDRPDWELAASRAWPVSLQLQQDADDDSVFEAMECMSSARCYLHYRSGRDENVVSWESQEDLAARGIGSTDVRSRLPSGCGCTFATQMQSIATRARYWTSDLHEFGAGTVVPVQPVQHAGGERVACPDGVGDLDCGRGLVRDAGLGDGQAAGSAECHHDQGRTGALPGGGDVLRGTAGVQPFQVFFADLDVGDADPRSVRSGPAPGRQQCGADVGIQADILPNLRARCWASNSSTAPAPGSSDVASDPVCRHLFLSAGSGSAPGSQVRRKV